MLRDLVNDLYACFGVFLGIDQLFVFILELVNVSFVRIIIGFIIYWVS